MSNELTKKCPYCSETNSIDANICRYCGKAIPSTTQTNQQDTAPQSQSQPQPQSQQNYGQAPPQQSAQYQNAYNRGYYVPHPEQLYIPAPHYTSGKFTAPYVVWVISYILSYFLFTIGFTALLIGINQKQEDIAVAGILILLVCGFIAIFYWISHLLLIYRCWSVIQDGFASTTPGKAVGFLFIPIFNIYWMVVTLYILGCELNNYIRRYRLNIAPCNSGLVLAWIIMNFIPYVNFLVIFIALPGFYTLMRTARDIQQLKMMYFAQQFQGRSGY